MANGISGSDFHGIGSLSCLCVRNDGGDGGLSVVSGGCILLIRSRGNRGGPIKDWMGLMEYFCKAGWRVMYGFNYEKKMRNLNYH